MVICRTFSTSAVGFDGQPLYYEIDWGPVTLADVRVEPFDSEGVSSVTADIESRRGSMVFKFSINTGNFIYADGTKLLNADSVGGYAMQYHCVWPAPGPYRRSTFIDLTARL